jgi:hypothetical protein
LNKENGHLKIFKNHNEPDCKEKGWDREQNAENEQGNKPDQAYYQRIVIPEQVITCPQIFL